MSNRKSVWAVTITAAMLLSSVLVLLSQKADAASWLTTSDTDFAPGNFFTGTGFETELHGTGVDAYVQNKKDLMTWFQKSPASDPGPRTAFGFSNDSLEGRIILFGGLDGLSSAHNDTWEYDIASNDWVRICSDNICPPWKRSYASMAYDNDSKIAVMYGGYAEDSTTILTDTWEYDVATNTWENWTAAFRPRGLTSHSMVYDAVDQRMILVGRGVASTEVWAYGQMTHTWTNMSTIGGPSKRYGFALGYSYQPGHHRVVLFGGAEVMTLYDETWEYNYVTNTWSQVNPVEKPSARTGASMTYNFKQSIEGLTLFGGNSWSMETWRYNWTGGTPDWTQLMLISNPAPGRTNHGLAYDPGHGKMILYGGTSSTGSRRNDTWMLENGYRLEGRYASSFFNTYTTATQWQYIFWNQPPANVPPNTIIRFQIETSNTCNNSDLPNWRGPNGASNTYYTTPGEAIWGGASLSKCIRFLADLINLDSSVAPELQDVTIIYDSGDPLPPRVESVSPTGAYVPLNAPILINFTRPMDTDNVFISVIPNVTFGPPIWSESDTKVMYNHNAQPFLEGHRYDICVWGTDTLGRPLDYTNGRYCWLFTTKVIQPVIVATVPMASSIDNSLNAPIVITFSEPMNTSTCWPYVTIDPVLPPTLAFDGHSWSVGDTVLTMTHSVPFAQFTTYTVEVPANDPARPCLDKTGVPLGFGFAANPWSFTTFAINPYITLTDPMNLQPRIPVSKTIAVKFSRDMDVNMLYYALKEYDGISWKNSTMTLIVSWTTPRILTLGHSMDFSSCRPYQIQIWALDISGRPLISNPNAPNPWRFETGNSDPNGCPPYMAFTSPRNGEENISQWMNISIFWYYEPDPPAGGMEPAEFRFSIKDDYGNDVTSRFTPSWIGMPGMVELQHPGYPLAMCMQYTVNVLAAKDKLGRDFVPGMVENPFKFKTSWTSCPPVMLWTQPADGAWNVPGDQDIQVKFSKTMDTASVTVSLTPMVPLYTHTWTEADTNLTITHAPFPECVVFALTINGKDASGNRLAPGPVPNPWHFATAGSCPVIISTDPIDGAMDVPIVYPITVVFSNPMNISSVVVDIVPDIPLAYGWSDNNQTLVLIHSTPFNTMTTYAVTVSGKTATGIGIGPGPVPNPWHFSTTCLCSVAGLAVHRQSPADVFLTWKSNPALVHYKVFHSTDRFAPWPWTVIAYVTTNYYLAAGHIADMSNHFYIVRGYMADGSATANSTMGALWHASVNPGAGKTSTFWFSLPYHTIYRKASDIANELTSSKINIVAKWDLAKQKSMVYYYNRGRWRGDDFDIYMGDGLWLGVMSAFDWAVNGTDTSHALDFRANPSPKQNYNFISLPYTNAYPDAKSISDQLTSSRVVEIGRWDQASQSWQKWTWSGGAWTGMNFAILPGDGFYLLIVAYFAWSPRLITPEIP